MSTLYYTDSQQRSIFRAIPDIVRYRRLLFDLFSKELRALYRNAVIGLMWTILLPLLMTLILTFVFTMVFRLGLPARSAAPLILCGVVPWQFLSAAVSRGTASIVKNDNLVKKVYFPRELIPLASVLNCMVNLGIGFLLLLAVHIVLGGRIGLAILWVPLIVAVELALVAGIALLCSCLNVFYRDVTYIVEVLLAFGFYATPVFYDLSFVTASFAKRYPRMFSLYMLNPMVGIITACRRAILEGVSPEPSLLLWPTVAALGMLVFGIAVFRRKAPILADYL